MSLLCLFVCFFFGGGGGSIGVFFCYFLNSVVRIATAKLEEIFPLLCCIISRQTIVFQGAFTGK